MFDFGFSEIVLTSAIALIVLGPEKLPKVARQVGNWMGRARSMARQLTEQLEREVSAEDLLKQSKTNSAATAAPYVPSSQNTPPTQYAPPADPYRPPPEGTPPSSSVTPAAGSASTEPTYSANPSSPPHGADWHPASPETKSSDG